MAEGASRRAGAALGLAFSVKQWAVIGAAVVLVGRSRRSAVVAAGVATVVGVVAYAPFVLFGDFNTLQHVWHFRRSTMLGWVWARTGLTQWAVRTIQGGVAAAVGALVAWRRPSAPAVVAMAAIGTRILLDRYPLPYYVCPYIAVFVLWLWTSRRSGTVWLQLGLSLCCAGLLAPSYSGTQFSVLTVLLVLGGLVWAVAAERDDAGAGPAGPLVDLSSRASASRPPAAD